MKGVFTLAHVHGHKWTGPVVDTKACNALLEEVDAAKAGWNGA